jgi:hypothetical protein
MPKSNNLPLEEALTINKVGAGGGSNFQGTQQAPQNNGGGSEDPIEQGVMSLIAKIREYKKQYHGQGMSAPRLMAVSQLIYHNHPSEVLAPRNIRQLMQQCVINFIPPPDPRRLKPVSTTEPEEALIDCDKFIKAVNESLATYKQRMI